MAINRYPAREDVDCDTFFEDINEFVVDAGFSTTYDTGAVAETASTTVATPTDSPINSGLQIGVMPSSNLTQAGYTASTVGPTVRPTGTQAGDLLFLCIGILSSASAPAITGWTLIGGPSTVVTTTKWCLYQRTADMTATDLPTAVTLGGSTTGNYGLYAFRASAVSGSVVYTDAIVNADTSTRIPSFTTIAPNSLVVTIFVARNGSAISLFIGGPTPNGWIISPAPISTQSGHTYLNSTFGTQSMAYKWMPTVGATGVGSFFSNVPYPMFQFALV